VTVRIAPSIIASDFLALGDAVAAVESGGADYIHVDVMDGLFVPNITIGPGVVEALRRATKLPLDVHLMIREPERYLEDFAKAGANVLTVHLEATTHLHRTVSAIHALGLEAGVALNPATPVGTLDEIVADLDVVLIMSVNPGFSWQTFIPRSESKTAAVRQLIEQSGSKARIELDGGVDVGNIGRLAAAGGSVFVAGGAVFGADDPAAAVRNLKEAARQ
jgi:ribulose-phosphate 3-epimerase